MCGVLSNCRPLNLFIGSYIRIHLNVYDILEHTDVSRKFKTTYTN